MTADPVELLRRRVEVAGRQLHAIPATGPGVFGSPDPETGERWNAGNVLGHVAEMLEFWTGQARTILEGASEAGRGTAGYESRREGIDSGRELAEADLRARIESGIAELLALLEAITPADLERPIVYHARVGEQSLTLSQFLDQLLIGHLESHARQLQELS